MLLVCFGNLGGQNTCNMTSKSVPKWVLKPLVSFKVIMNDASRWGDRAASIQRPGFSRGALEVSES